MTKRQIVQEALDLYIEHLREDDDIKNNKIADLAEKIDLSEYGLEDSE